MSQYSIKLENSRKTSILNGILCAILQQTLVKKTSKANERLFSLSRADCSKADVPGNKAEHNGLTQFGRVSIVLPIYQMTIRITEP